MSAVTVDLGSWSTASLMPGASPEWHQGRHLAPPLSVLPQLTWSWSHLQPVWHCLFAQPACCSQIWCTGSGERKYAQGFIYSQHHLWPQSKEEPLAGFNLQHRLDNTNSQTCEWCWCGWEGHTQEDADKRGRCRAKGSKRWEIVANWTHS